MTITDCNIPALKILDPVVYDDDRGYFKETFRESMLEQAGLHAHFVQDNISSSVKNTVRGLHYQLERPQIKLVQCIQGEILDVAVDVRRDSPTFGNYVAVKLSGKNHRLLYIPHGFAHGFSVLTDHAVIHYKCSDYYHKASERGIRWDDSSIKIEWNVNNPVISEKDRDQPLFSSLTQEDLFT